MSRRTVKIVYRHGSGVQCLLATLLKNIGAAVILEQTDLEGILDRIREHCRVLALNEARWNYALAAQLIGVGQNELRKRQWKKRGKRSTGPIPPRPKDRTSDEEE